MDLNLAQGPTPLAPAPLAQGPTQPMQQQVNHT